jgi:hypothetical protein
VPLCARTAAGSQKTKAAKTTQIRTNAIADTLSRREIRAVN